LDERELIRRMQARDPLAFAEVYDRYQNKIYNLCLRLVRDRHHARDLLHEAFVRLLEKFGTFRGEASFSSWFQRLAANLSISFLRKERRLVFPDADEDGGSFVDRVAAAGQASPVESEQLRRAVERLPEGYRVVFVLHDVYGHSHQEIAEACGFSVGNSKAQLSKARNRLRKFLYL
jgi:RNA polymerase sigma-70 factor (ECF subfamily)